jgi:RNA polymerase sigma factor (sigma-70 family)
MIYEIGRTPRKNKVVYQRMYSAASRLDSGMVDWRDVLKHAKLFHTTGITFGLAYHSQYERNYNYEAFKEAMSAKPAHCLVGLDFNYRSTLWTPEQVRKVMAPILSEHIDILITSIGDMASFYGIGCGQYTAEQVVNDDIGQLEDEGFKQALASAIQVLPQKEQLMMSLYYSDELNLKEIGEILGVSESRVSQIHGQALARVRAHMSTWVS